MSIPEHRTLNTEHSSKGLREVSLDILDILESNGNAHEFVDLCMASHQRYRSTGHCIFNHQIDLEDDGSSARGEIYCITWLFHEDKDQLDTWYGRYLDRYEKRADEWRISERVCVHEGTETRQVDPMGIDAGSFRQGSFDRPSSLRPIGP